MSNDNVFNALCSVFFNEEVRLLNKVTELEKYLSYHPYDKFTMIELIETRANLIYFKTYIIDILNYINSFDR